MFTSQKDKLCTGAEKSCDINKIELSQCNIKKNCAQLLTSLSPGELTRNRWSTYGITPPPFLDIPLLMATHPPLLVFCKNMLYVIHYFKEGKQVISLNRLTVLDVQSLPLRLAPSFSFFFLIVYNFLD